MDKISFNLSLARGLDYYTSIIYEAVVEASAPLAFHANATAPASASITTGASEGAKKGKKDNTTDAGEEAVDASVMFDAFSARTNE